jgi:AraC-like DNA-binding protein
LVTVEADIEVVTADAGKPFRALVHRGAAFPGIWHRHPEVELVGIVSGDGERRVGDRIDALTGPQVLLLGPHLPHTCVHPAAYEHLVFQFRRDCLGRDFFAIAGAEAVAAMLDRASGGLIVDGPAAGALLDRMRAVIPAQGLDAVAGLITCLAAFAAADPQPLAADDRSADPRLHRVLAWIDRHAGEDVSLDDAAAEADMHPKAFARWFRRASGHSFHGYLGHVRIGRACARLRDGDDRITDIALGVGFGTLASFNRLFLRLRKMTPSAYRKRSRP